MRRFVAHPARYLHKMADSMSYELGALIEPLSVAYNAVVRAAPYLGQPVVIAGAGPIGLSMALCARAAGCHPICITDLEENRLQQARDFGFDRTLRIDTSWDRLETAERVRSVMGAGCMPSIVFECTGAASSIYSACYVSRCLVDSVISSRPGTRKRRDPLASWLRQAGRRDPAHVDGLQGDQHCHKLPIHPVMAGRPSSRGRRGVW